MIRYKAEIQHALNTLYKCSGIGAVCLDSGLNLVDYCPSRAVADDFLCLASNQISSLLAEEFAVCGKLKKNFYTYFLEGNLVCSVVPVCADEEFLGAVITQPVLLSNLNAVETENLLRSMEVTENDSKFMRSVLARTPVVPYERIMPVGEVLFHLIGNMFKRNPAHQVLGGERGRGLDDGRGRVFFRAEHDKEHETIGRNVPMDIYYQVKESIQAGDAKAAEAAVLQLSPGDIDADRYGEDLIRSLKNFCTKVIFFGCFAAIEANAPYYKTLSAADEMVMESESLESVQDLFDLMRRAILRFAQTVSISSISGYSKPIRQVMEYIQQHYAEKITLKSLAKHTNLSAFYLSSLIKKETGLILMDNINSVRIEESKKLLLAKNVSIIDVAQQVGFTYQNHFSTTFKKFTGLTPTEFVKAGSDLAAAEAGQETRPGIIRMLAEQLHSKLLLIPWLCEAARIVDPATNKSWIITDRAKDLEPEQETCYAFWCKKKSCEKCVSSVSYLLDRPVFKLEQMKNRVYLVAATPLKAANTTVVVETIKEVTNAFFTETDLQEADRLSQEYFKALPARQSSGDIYDRNLVDRFLPVSIRRARMEEKPLSLIMTAVDYLDSVDCETQPGAREDVLNRYVAAISEEMKEENGWAGRFTGDIFIIVLHETDDKKAHAFAQNLKSRFQSETEGAEESGTRKLSPAFGIKTVEKAIVNPGAVVKEVLAALLKDRYDGSDRKEEYAITT